MMKKLGSGPKMAIWMATGGVIGFLSGYLAMKNGLLTKVKEAVVYGTDWLGRYGWQVLLGIFLIELLLCLRGFYRMKSQYRLLHESDSDVFMDKMEGEIEKDLSVTNLSSSALFIFASFLLAAAIQEQDANALPTAGIYLAVGIVKTVFEIKSIKLVQKEDPGKKGDPADISFQKDYLESCDEAEKEIIYQTSYHTYMKLQTFMPIFLVMFMLLAITLQEGLLAVAAVGIVWLFMLIVYHMECIKSRKRKIS